MKPVTITNKEILKRTIEIKEYAIGALMHLYSYQTADEQRYHCTTYENGEGFNGNDSGFCTSLAKQYLEKQRLTEKQLAALRKLLPKYHKQISVLQPMPLKTQRKRTKRPVQTKVATLFKDRIEIRFPYDSNTVAGVKSLSNRKWNPTNKIWTASVGILNVISLMEMEFTLKIDKSAELDPIIRNLRFLLNAGKTADKKEGKLHIPGLNATLRKYQEEGVRWIESRNGRALIGDDMGVGKTMQALAWMQLRKKDCLPALVVCTASTKIHWARSARDFTELKPVMISGKDNKVFTGFTESRDRDVYVTNYDIIHTSKPCGVCKGTGKLHGIKCKSCRGKGKLVELDPQIAKLGFKTVVFDECHYLKSNTAGRTIAAKQLSSQCDFVLALSGTPIVNRPIEFFNTINLVNNKLFPDWFAFTKRYCDRKHTGWGWDVTGSSNKKELHWVLSNTLMIRRMKSDVLKELPPKVRTVIPMEINKDKYHKMVDKWRKELAAANSKSQHLTIIEKAKQSVVQLKMDLCLEWISDFLETGRKLVVFADHRELAEKVVKHFREKSVIIYGGVSENKRQAAVDSFQNDPNRQLFVGTKAAKEGLTLTAADTVAFLELWWTPGDHDQAEDRVLRIGQKSDKMNAYYLLAERTIEEDIAALLDEKRKVTKAALDGADVEAESMLSAIMGKILKKEKEEA